MQPGKTPYFLRICSHAPAHDSTGRTSRLNSKLYVPTDWATKLADVTRARRVQQDMTDGRQLLRARLGIVLLICLYIVVCCISLVCVADINPVYHIVFDSTRLLLPVAAVAAFAVVGLLFAFADFSFGYFVGFYLYAMVAGYIWENFFSEFYYNHQLSGLSAAASAVALLLPVLFITAPIRQLRVISSEVFDRLLTFIVLLALATVVLAATYNFRFVALQNIYTFREELTFPAILNYLIAITSSALLPFAFACYVTRKDTWRAVAVLLLLTFYYPITLSKVALFTPAWLVIIMLLSRFFEARRTVILSLLVPPIIGLILFALFESQLVSEAAAIPYFEIVNFRMIAIPSIAMDFYNDFFFRHELTYFCQLRVLKPLVSCPYQDPLAIVIFNEYGIGGNFNASLFATEGIASVGVLFAPVAVFGCGLVIALGNRLSAGLPPRFILISGAILPQILLNVPLTITLLTHGAALLFVLWYITPRTMFETGANKQIALAH